MRSPVRAESSDDETAAAIVRLLRAGRVSSQPVEQVKSSIEGLRVYIQDVRRRGRRSDVDKTMKQIEAHARALASAMEKLDPDWRWYLRLVTFHERRDGVPLIGVTPDHEAETRMADWISDLRRIPHECTRMVELARDFFPGEPKMACAHAASRVIGALSPAMKLTKGDSSKFYQIAEWLWEAASGDKTSMKRSCDAYIDRMKREQR